MDVFLTSKGHLHHMQQGHEERPDRLRVIQNSLSKALNLQVNFVDGLPASEKQLLMVHSKNLIDLIESTSHKKRIQLTPDTQTNKHTWDAARYAAGAAIQAALRAFYQHVTTFALVRPPGHHATHTVAMGFCIFNNVAIAAENLIKQCGVQKIAIVDLDQHHGNGIESIFYERPDVMYLSCHADPELSYPRSGHLESIGAKEGIGYTVNIPVPVFSGDGDFLSGVRDVIVPIVTAYKPEILLISLGFDGLKRDPYGQLSLSVNAFYQMGRLMQHLKSVVDNRVAVMLEGGYIINELGNCAVKFFEGLELQNPQPLEITPSAAMQKILLKVQQLHFSRWDLKYE